MRLQQLRKIMGPANALEIGKAAEYLVCADLILSGYRAFLASAGLPYDVVLDAAGRLVRIQVKATCFPRNLNAAGLGHREGYSFHVRAHGKTKLRRLTNEACDLIALVALDINAIAYLPISKVGETCQLMPPGHDFSSKYKRTHRTAIDGFLIEEALVAL